MTDARPPRLLLPTPPRAPLEQVVAALPGALATGRIACLRLDLPGATEAEVRRAADALRPLCHEADVPVILRDHAALAAPLGLDGVQVEARAHRLRDLRKTLGPDAVMGVACGASRHDGMTAAEAGADYVLFGPLAAGSAGAEPVAPEVFEIWSESIETPVVAEGGLGAASAGALGAWLDFGAPDAEVWDGDLAAALIALADALDAA
ncbi:MAG: thiamine phosphate synthase [Pseudomonadota bacterium]